MKKLLKGLLIILVVIVAVTVVGGGIGLIYLTSHEYKPEPVETVENYGQSSRELAPGDTVSILTYNIGYGANDAEHDFFMDGGKTVNTESADNINRNINGIISTLYEAKADINLLQEVDIDSKRSYNIDEASMLSGAFSDCMYAFANNYLCDYVPYPFPTTIGKVNAGIMTISPYSADSVERIALSNSFSWPVSTCQLKRCLLVERIPLTDSNKKLVVVNLHLEAYDGGDMKLEQFKELCDFIKMEYANGNYVVAGGDFNSTLPSVDSSRYPLKITDNFMPAQITTDYLQTGWKYGTDDSVPSSRLLNEPYDPESENTQLYVLDGFICSPNVLIENVKTIDTGFNCSDHNPVIADFTLVN